MKDSEFIRGKVPMTKEVVRAVILDFLDISKIGSFIDIGAGTGSVSIQGARTNPSCRVTAVETNPQALDLIRENVDKFGLKNIDLVEGLAPCGQIDSKFDGAYVGGSKGRLEEIIDWIHGLLNEGGVLVLSFILIENAMKAYDYLREGPWENISMVKVEAAELTKLGPGHYFKPNNPSLVIRAERKEND